jgi:hypothetical protein
MPLTARQCIALHLYYVAGQNLAVISSTLGCTPSGTFRIVQAAKAKLGQAYEDDPVKFLPLIEGLLRPSPTASVTRHVGKSLSRQDELWAALEMRLHQRANELADIVECMGHDCALPTRQPGGRGGMSVGPNGTRWPAEKWQHRDGRVEMLPCDDDCA